MYIDSERFTEMVKGLIPDSYENDYGAGFCDGLRAALVVIAVEELKATQEVEE